MDRGSPEGDLPYICNYGRVNQCISGYMFDCWISYFRLESGKSRREDNTFLVSL